MYHPYCHSPSALTEYLKQKLRVQRAKCLGRSPSAQVEQNIPLKRNIPRALKSTQVAVILLMCWLVISI